MNLKDQPELHEELFDEAWKPPGPTRMGQRNPKGSAVTATRLAHTIFTVHHSTTIPSLQVHAPALISPESILKNGSCSRLDAWTIPDA